VETLAHTMLERVVRAAETCRLPTSIS
jgi:hypothetical protein